MLRLCLLPQSKVSLVPLLADTGKGIAACVLHVLQRASGEDAIFEVFVVLLYVKVYGAVADVGIAVVYYLPYQLLLLYDMTSGMRLYAWRQHIELLHSAVEAARIVSRYLHGLQLLHPGLLGYLVLALVGIVFQMAHVGDVPDIAHLVAQMLQVAV